MICASCHNDLHESEFSPGLLKRSRSHWLCRKCQSERVREYKRQHPEKVREYDKRYESSHKNERAAKHKIMAAIDGGRVTKDACAVCGTMENVQAHHLKYESLDDWFTIVWLCPVHHKAVHYNRIEIDESKVVRVPKPRKYTRKSS